MKNLIIAIGNKAETEYDITDEINRISLIKLIDGGAAMLEAVNKNHHIVIIGATDINPFVRNILRVCVISYLILAMMNRAEDPRP